MAVYAYYRVSSDKQRKDRTIESQMFAVEELAKRLGVVIADSFKDEAVSGTAAPKDRPGYAALAASLKKDDVLLLDSIDRISRVPRKLQLYVLQLQDEGVEIHCVNEFDEQVLHNEELGPMMLGAAATIAGLKIKEVRTKTTNALNRVRKAAAEGKSDKRPGRKANYDPKELCAMLDKGIPVKVISERLGISRRTVYYWQAELAGHSRNVEGSIPRKELMM